jgi:hypothetical protein
VLVKVFLGPTVTPCGHTFCHFCILEWTADKRNCPICRKWIADAGGLQKHVEMDNFVGKMYAFLAGTALTARAALIRDRALQARSASARREATATSSSSSAAMAREARLRYGGGGGGYTSSNNSNSYFNSQLERRRRLERFMELDDNGRSTSRVEAYPTPPPSSWRTTSTLLLQQHNPVVTPPAPPASSLPAPLATPATSMSASTLTSQQEEVNVQRELYRRLVYSDSERFGAMPASYQAHILRTLYGDSPTAMNAMLNSRPSNSSTSARPSSSLWDDSPPRYVQALRRIQADSSSISNSVASMARTRAARLYRLHRYGGGTHERACDSAGNGGTTTTGSGADRPRCSSSRAAELIQSVLGRTSAGTARTAGGGDAAAAVMAASNEAERDRSDRAVGEGGGINEDNVGLLSPAEPDESNNSGSQQEVRDWIK